MNLFDDAVIYQRTTLGRQRLLSATSLDRSEMAFLGAVTGFTPLRTLAELMADQHDLTRVVPRLLDAGLIEAVEPEARRVRVLQAC